MLRSLSKEFVVRKSNPTMYMYFPFNLTGEQAFLSALILESAVRALWREYGDDMAAFQGRVFPDMPSPLAEGYCTRPASNDEGDF